jgi:hypothetical protein
MVVEDNQGAVSPVRTSADLIDDVKIRSQLNTLDLQHVEGLARQPLRQASAVGVRYQAQSHVRSTGRQHTTQTFARRSRYWLHRFDAAGVCQEVGDLIGLPRIEERKHGDFVLGA